MSLLSGGFSLTRFKIGSKIGLEAIVKGLQTFKANEIVTAEKNESFGWAIGYNFLDTKFNVEKIAFGAFYLFSMRLTFKKVPANLIKAHCQQEEIKKISGSKKAQLSRFEKSEIKSEIKDRLFEEQPIEYKVFDCLIDSKNGVIYFTGTSTRIIKEFIKLFELSFSITPLLLDAAGLSSVILSATNFKALKRLNANWFSPLKGGIDSAVSLEEFLGPDFLTWLWFQIEFNEAQFSLNNEKVSLIFEDFLLLKNPFSGPQDSLENTVKDGTPTICPESAAALYCGKKLYQAKIFAVIEESNWSFRFDCTKMSLTGIKLPSLEEENPDDAYIERFENIQKLTDIIDSIFGYFLEDFLSEDWENTVSQMKKWIKAKKLKATE